MYAFCSFKASVCYRCSFTHPILRFSTENSSSSSSSTSSDSESSSACCVDSALEIQDLICSVARATLLLAPLQSLLSLPDI